MSGKIECVGCEAPQAPQGLGAPASAVAVTPEQALALMTKTLTDLAGLEGAVASWQGSVFRMASAGLMTCGEIRDYNQFALATWAWERQVLSTLHAAAKGTAVEQQFSKFVPLEPRDPVLFGHSIGPGAGGQLTVSLNCPDNALVDPTQLKQFGQPSAFPCVPEDQYTKGNTLAGLPAGLAAVCAAGAQAALGCAVAGVIVVGGAAVAYAIIKNITGTAAEIWLGSDRINLEHARIRAQNNARRAILIETCVTRHVQSGLTGAALLDARNKCVKDAIRTLPDPSAGLAATSFTRNLIVLTAVVGVGVIGGIVAWTYYKKGRKSLSSSAESSSSSSKPKLKRVA